jgi:hypothetical protein
MDSTGKVKTKLLFEPLMVALSFQGIGDDIVLGYMEEHGMITYFQIARRLGKHRREFGRLCYKLKSFDSFKGCGYQKGRVRCKNSIMLKRCPVRTHDMLKGVLNVKAYSFFFYIRDVCQGDMINHFDKIIGKHFKGSIGDSEALLARSELVSDFTRVFGIGEKLANMTLSFLMCANPDNPTWIRVGQAMVAVDSLVHNFLHRTGILRFYELEHNYGPACSNRCAYILDILIRKIDAREFNPAYPEYFPRFVQYSIWRFCSLAAHDICNGVKINDSQPCRRKDICPVFRLCDRITLKPEVGGSDDTTGSKTA